MAVTAEARKDGGIVLYYSDVVTVEQVINVKKSLVTEENKGLRYLIVDVAADADVNLSTADLHAIVEENKRLAAIAKPGMPVAVTSPQDLGFGLARLWEALAAETGWRIHVFRSRAEADSWIQQCLSRVA